jgi:glycosyltransferase involved in cell wall biosynthesis
MNPPAHDALTLINISENAPSWNWLAPRFTQEPWRWVHFSRLAQTAWPAALRGWVSAFKAAWFASKQTHPLLVAHGPRVGIYTCLAGALLCRRAPVLVYAFNYTELPEGWRRRMARFWLQRSSCNVVFSTLEKTLYARHLQLPPERFEQIYWGVEAATSTPTVAQPPYICALGSQGRDYATLFRAMARLPHIPLVAVMHPENLVGLKPPANVTVHQSIPGAQAIALLDACRFMVLPLSGGRVPCGHVTAVSAMHRGKAMVCTDSVGLNDYAIEDRTSLNVPPADEQAMARAIDRLWNEPGLAEKLGAQGLQFAQQHCTESAVVAWFQGFLRRAADSSA